MSSNLRVQELDFDTIKENLREFLRGKPEFTDYDFEGSGINALLNILAYNTHYMGVLANLQMQELFLDTASKRTTAAMHASRLGYIPGSKKSPVAKVNLEIFPSDSPATLTLGRGAVFETTISGTTYQFVTTDAMTTVRTNGRYLFENVTIREGTMKLYRYLTVEGTENRFVIPSTNVDITTLSVKVQTSASNTTFTSYDLNTSIADITSTTPVYYMRLNSEGYYEIYFGDDVISKSWTPGNIIVLEYIETNGPATNGAAVFNFADTVQGYSESYVTVNVSATGGENEETVDQIRVNAQASVGTQNRAVTTSDFYSAIRSIYPIDSLAVWGGDQNIPKVYGKVYIAIKPIGTAEVLTQTTKQYIIDELIKKKNVVTVTPVIVDPSYIYLEVDTNVYYKDTATEYSSSTIETIVRMAIQSYASANIGKFNSSLRFSKLGSAIDTADTSIQSNITKIIMKKTVPVQYLSTADYTVDFGNPFISGTLNTSGVTVLGNSNTMYIDDLDGILRLYYMDGYVKKVYASNVGTVNYKTGIITFSALNLTSDVSNITIRVTPESNDVIAVRSNILEILDTDVTVTPIVEQADLTKHIFTASR